MTRWGTVLLLVALAQLVHGALTDGPGRLEWLVVVVCVALGGALLTAGVVRERSAQPRRHRR